MGLLTTIKQRWKADLPPFFKGVRKLSITIGTSAMAVWGVNTALNLELPELVLTVCKYSISACFALGLGAQLTQKDAPKDDSADTDKK